ncbi:MAG: hypothetical protein VKJ24_17655 [Synechococcales bacterium]|nr:hypothetical protein [Synechococcales bacterium]
MKLQTVKQEVFSLTQTTNTKQLRKQHPKLMRGRDLRYKAQWLEILEQVKLLRQAGEDLSLADLEASEQMLKHSLFKVGQMAGIPDSDLELDWQRIKLEAQFGDIHIEEL